MHFTTAGFLKTACMCIIAALGHVESKVIMRDVNETEMFYYEIRPELFNWTNGADNKFVFTPSLQNYPDLLHWIHYKFNSKNRHGYLYGTPPANLLERQILLDIIGLNKKTYQVETQVIQLNIFEKSEYATNEVRFKINNLNVEDMFNEERIPYLLDIFRQYLWVGSKQNLYVTFLASASDLGQRLPLDPNDTEGVVVNLGSSSNFSTILYDLEKEISPLQKMNKCPKDFKRTSVERYFRANGFNLDWCSFKLVELTIIFNQNQTMNVQDKISSTKYAEENVWELVESLQYSQSKHTDTTKFKITLVVFIIFVIGLILSIGIFGWYKKKVIFFKNI
ncbi:epsilon-sarcoglycan [Rhopalosiphum maidis]|uniref:epsilon-sarcoglycan n=1 Tax=Rhopalosiphum maidis TaxID=43146 RepID=UPI000EFEC65E|nr:epsilon-sarcoglycan [Rhopalosiphum maidis]